jgi:hypothetical protein
MFASLVKLLAVTEGFDVFTETDKAGEMEDVCEFRFCVAVMDQVPSERVPKVQLVAPPAPAALVVQVTLLEEALAAVTVTVAPSVTPVKSKVGVLSEVLLSVLLEPESEFRFRSGAANVASPVIAVALEGVAAVVPPTFEAVTTARKYLPTELIGIV